MSSLTKMALVLTGHGAYHPSPAPRVKPGGRAPVKVPIGTRFGALTVLAEGERYQPDAKGYRGRRWLCRCDCDVVRNINMNNLRRGLTLSCGCCIGLATRFTSETGKRARGRQLG